MAIQKLSDVLQWLQNANTTENEVIDENKPAISIIGTTYNQKKLLERGLAVWCEQKTAVPYEIIVVDDASPDGSIHVIREFKKKDPFVRGISALRKDSKELLVCSATNNLGVRLAKANIVAITWFDRIPLKNAVNELFYPHMIRKNILVSIDAMHIGTTSSLEVIPEKSLDQMLSAIDWRNNPIDLYRISRKGFHNEFKNIIESACFSLSKKTYEEIGGYDERYKMLPSMCNIELYRRLIEYGLTPINGDGAVFHQPHESPRSPDGHARAHIEASKIDDKSIIRNNGNAGSMRYEEIRI